MNMLRWCHREYPIQPPPPLEPQQAVLMLVQKIGSVGEGVWCAGVGKGCGVQVGGEGCGGRKSVHNLSLNLH